ncbi:hypothetical protein QTP88_004535 [Uroleucon formosanum]
MAHKILSSQNIMDLLDGEESELDFSYDEDEFPNDELDELLQEFNSNYTLDTEIDNSNGEYLKKFYAGIVLVQLETDDYECKCECGQYPVINIAIDGWTGSPFKDCPAINKN